MTADEHGSASTYSNYQCRCDECRIAHAEQARRGRQARKRALEVNPDLAPHGNLSTYTNWLCRCEKCTHANAVAAKRRKMKS